MNYHNSNFNYIIEVKNLSKNFKIPKKNKDLSWFKKKISWIYREWEIKKAVKNISFNIKKGEIVGYLGPNGAGKSTTIKMLTGILYPTSGEIKIFNNLNPFVNRKEYTQNIGVVFGQRSILTYDIPVKDSFKLFKAIYNLEDKFFEERLNYLINLLDIKKLLEIPYRMLSLGEKMRCELAASFIHKPKIVFLDEPTIGLDASAKIKIRNFLKEINKKEKVTIIITTHDMDDIEELCERIILINEGKIMYDGNLKKFKNIYSNWKKVEIYYNNIKNKKEFNNIKKKYKCIEINDKNIIFNIPNDNSLSNFLNTILKSLEIIDLTISEPKLENIIAKIYENKND
jgi:ABC-2 type transport system ATP-binding protein